MDDDEATAEQTDDTADETVDDEDLQQAIDFETQRRLWVRSLIPLLQMRSHDSDPSGRVQLAFDLMHIAACERIGRICHSDLGEEQG
jgi:hypothetical protein